VNMQSLWTYHFFYSSLLFLLLLKHFISLWTLASNSVLLHSLLSLATSCQFLIPTVFASSHPFWNLTPCSVVDIGIHGFPAECNFHWYLLFMPIPVAARCMAWVCDHSLAGIADSSHVGCMDVSAECCVLSGRCLCVGLTRPKESCRVVCVWVWSWSHDNEEALAV
jgi:hypothetical protein